MAAGGGGGGGGGVTMEAFMASTAMLDPVIPNFIRFLAPEWLIRSKYVFYGE